jgi:hypothetical protein
MSWANKVLAEMARFWRHLAANDRGRVVFSRDFGGRFRQQESPAEKGTLINTNPDMQH